MAESKFTPIKLDRFISFERIHFEEIFAPGVSRQMAVCAVFRGRRDALIAAGVSASDWFQDGTKIDARGRVRHRRQFTMDGRTVRTTESGGTCEVQISYTLTEAARYRTLREEEFSRRRTAPLPSNVIRFPGPRHVQ